MNRLVVELALALVGDNEPVLLVPICTCGGLLGEGIVARPAAAAQQPRGYRRRVRVRGLAALLLGHGVAGVDPVVVDVDGCGQICGGSDVFSVDRAGERTVHGRLEGLAADLAGQGSDAGLLVDLDGDRVLVVAEEA